MNEKKNCCDWSGRLCWVCSFDWLDSALAGGKEADPHLEAWFGGGDVDPMLLGEVTDSSPPGSGSPAAWVYLSLPPTRQDLT